MRRERHNGGSHQTPDTVNRHTEPRASSTLFSYRDVNLTLPHVLLNVVVYQKSVDRGFERLLSR